MEIRRQIFQQNNIARLSAWRKRLEVDDESAEAARGKKLRGLPPEKGPRVRIFQEVSDVDPVRTVRIVDHGKNLHGRVLILQEGHDAVVHRQHAAALDHVEILVRLVVYPLQAPVWCEYVQPIGIQDVNLVGEGSQGRK